MHPRAWFAALLPLSWFGSVLAEVKICNEYDEPVFVAAGSEHNGAVRTMGWWEVAPGDCRVINSGAVVVPTYVHAQTQEKPVRGGALYRESWGTDRKLVVSKGPFSLEHAERTEAGDVQEQFVDLTKGVAGQVKGVTYTIKRRGEVIDYTCGPGEHMAMRLAPLAGVSCEK